MIILLDRQVGGDFPSLLRAGDVLVVNNTEVIPARLRGKRGEASISVTLHSVYLTMFGASLPSLPKNAVLMT